MIFRVADCLFMKCSSENVKFALAGLPAKRFFRLCAFRNWRRPDICFWSIEDFKRITESNVASPQSKLTECAAVDADVR